MNATRSYHDDRIESLRVPPHSVEVERAVLGGLMIAPNAIWLVRDALKPDAFYCRNHRLIFEAICAMSDQRKPFDVVTLGDWFAANGASEQIGGAGYLIELATTTPSAANIRAYAEIVREKRVLRELIDAGMGIVNRAYEPGHTPAIEILTDCQQAMGNVLQGQPMELESLTDTVDALIADAARADEQPEIRGLTTGLPDVDQILGGLREGQLIVLAARPKMGKTTFAQNIAEHVALRLGRRVAIHSLEMGKDQVTERMVCSLGGIDANRMRHRTLNDWEWSEFTRQTGIIRRAPFLVSGPRNVRVEQIIAQTQRAHSEAALGLVIIDYLQLIDIGRAENENVGYGQITRQLKLAAGAMRVPIILISQLNRSLESRTDKRPVPADLRSSGAIEQDADAVLFVYRDEVYHKRSPDRGTAELIVAIQRSGKPGMARVLSDLDRYRFQPLPEGWEPEPLPAESETKPARTRKSRFAAIYHHNSEE